MNVTSSCRHFAAALTPHAQDLPIRRALMYSDWEKRSASVVGAGESHDGDAEANRKLALREPLTQITTEIISGSVVSALAQAQALFQKQADLFETN